ncbi:MAG: hypothetical protein Q9202_000851 [Teloschistes flavicans]
MQNDPLLGPPIQHPGLPVRQPGPPIRHPGLLIRQPGLLIRQPGPHIQHPGLPIRQPGWYPNLVPVSSSSSAGTLIYTPTSDGSGGFNGPTPTAFPSPSFNLAAGSGSHISGHFTPSIGVEPVPADLSDATLASQHSVPGLKDFSASHHPSLNIPHLSQTQGIPPEQLWSRYNPSAPPALGGQHIVEKPLPIPVPPNLPLNRLRSVDLPCINAALPVPIPSNVYAPPHNRSNPPEVVINPQRFETAPWVPEPDAHILDSADGFRQINTYRNLGMDFSEIAEKMQAVGHPEATHEDVMGIWTRRTADRAQNWGNKKKVIPCEMGDDACDT